MQTESHSSADDAEKILNDNEFEFAPELMRMVLFVDGVQLNAFAFYEDELLPLGIGEVPIQNFHDGSRRLQG